MVRPVDTPFLAGDVYERLSAAMGAAPAAYCATREGPHPLCAIWTPRALDKLGNVLAARRHPPVYRFLDDIGAVRLIVDDVPMFGNVNTPEDLEAGAAPD